MAVLATLTSRERQILKLRYGLEDGLDYTLVEVGRIFKVTAARVRQIEVKALRKIREPVRVTGFPVLRTIAREQGLLP